jgi:hypothetical protein
MSRFSKFLPAVALAAVLASPLAANARSYRAPEAPAQQQVLVGQYNATQPQGRAAEINPSNGGSQLIVVSAPQYAALTGFSASEVN